MEIIRIDENNIILNIINNDFIKYITDDSDIKIFTIVSEKNGTIIYSNDNINNFFKQDIKNKKISELIDKKQYEEIRKIMLETIFTNKEILSEIKIYDRIYKILISPILNEQSDIKYLLVNCYDINKNKKIEEELESLKIKLTESNSIKSIFLSNISHELRTPMNAIIGFSDILLQSGLNKEQSDRFLKSINYNAKHLDELLNNILDLSRLESNEFDILYENFSINDLFEE